MRSFSFTSSAKSALVILIQVQVVLIQVQAVNLTHREDGDYANNTGYLKLDESAHGAQVTGDSRRSDTGIRAWPPGEESPRTELGIERSNHVDLSTARPESPLSTSGIWRRSNLDANSDLRGGHQGPARLFGRSKLGRRSEPQGSASGLFSDPGSSGNLLSSERAHRSSGPSKEGSAAQHGPSSPRALFHGGNLDQDFALYNYFKGAHGDHGPKNEVVSRGVRSANIESWAADTRKFGDALTAIKDPSPRIRDHEWGILKGYKPDGYHLIPKLSRSTPVDERMTLRLRQINQLGRLGVPIHQRPDLMLRLEAEARANLIEMMPEHRRPKFEGVAFQTMMREEEERIAKDETKRYEAAQAKAQRERAEEERAQRRKLKKQRKYQKKKKSKPGSHETVAPTSHTSDAGKPSSARQQPHESPKDSQSHERPGSPSQEEPRSSPSPGGLRTSPRRGSDSPAMTHQGDEPGSPSGSDNSEVFVDHMYHVPPSLRRPNVPKHLQ